MKKFSDRIRQTFYDLKGVDIDSVEYMDLPESKEDYNIDKTIGNINLLEGRFMTKSEADKIVDYFLNMTLP